MSDLRRFAAGILVVVTAFAGCKGDTGLNSLTDFLPESVGENCQYGGIKLLTGLDVNSNGVLDEIEISKVAYACNQRVDGDSSLITAMKEPVGANCAQGGVKVQVGLDDNDDRVLQAGEVDVTTFVCNGLSRLLNLSTVAPGTSCEQGGIRVEAGWDDDADGTLDAAEVDVTYNVCSGRSSLVKIVSVEEGSACPNGGIRVQNGFDVNGNSQLDTAEVQGTEYVCNGSDGFESLVKISNEPPSTTGACRFGGTRVETGLDLNDDGILQALEVETTSVVCSVPVNENLTLIRTSVVAPGAACAYGGVRTEIGIDDNNDRILQNTEVDTTTVNCNSVLIIDGITTRVDTVPATSLQCAFGGFVFRSGGDDNRNGVLDSGEVDDTEVVCNGANGFNSVVRSQPYSGATCGTDGGQTIQSGLDLNRNGTLEAAEVQNSTIICNGLEGLPGFNSMIDVTDAGSACGIFGGIRVRTGLDLDGDGILDVPSEVEQTSYVCNGQDGFNALISTQDAGSACGSYGGVRINVGLDTDFDLVLDSAEIDSWDYVCNGFDGYNNLVVQTEGDWSSCPAWGVRIESGLDLDEDGVLDFSEIEYTTYVCDGA